LKDIISNLVQIGSVIRLHGYKGEVKIAISEGIVLKNIKELVFIEFAQKPVPFFIVSNHQSKDQLILKLEDIDGIEAAEELMGRSVWVEKKMIKSIAQAFDMNEWNGYTVYDENKVKIGIAKELVNYNQWLLNIDIDGVEAMLPINDETLIDVKKAAKKVFVKIPDGLLDLYKES